MTSKPTALAPRKQASSPVGRRAILLMMSLGLSIAMEQSWHGYPQQGYPQPPPARQYGDINTVPEESTLPIVVAQCPDERFNGTYSFVVDPIQGKEYWTKDVIKRGVYTKDSFADSSTPRIWWGQANKQWTLGTRADFGGCYYLSGHADTPSFPASSRPGAWICRRSPTSTNKMTVTEGCKCKAGVLCTEFLRIKEQYNNRGNYVAPFRRENDTPGTHEYCSYKCKSANEVLDQGNVPSCQSYALAQALEDASVRAQALGASHLRENLPKLAVDLKDQLYSDWQKNVEGTDKKYSFCWTMWMKDEAEKRGFTVLKLNKQQAKLAIAQGRSILCWLKNVSPAKGFTALKASETSTLGLAQYAALQENTQDRSFSHMMVVPSNVQRVNKFNSSGNSFVVRNSWGNNAGQAGDGLYYLNYDLVDSPDWTFYDVVATKEEYPYIWLPGTPL